jgi:hypothetical protein
MAAHVLTGLHQVAEMANNDVTWAQLDAALQFSCWTEDLEDSYWKSLRQIVDDRDYPHLLAWVKLHEREYGNIWLDLGQPSTREEWNRVRFGLS